MNYNFNELSKEIFLNNKDNGFYDTPVEIPTALMLTVSELSEALEADRKDKYAQIDTMDYSRFHPDNPYFKGTFENSIKDTFEDEIADAIIRLLDLCGYHNIDIDKHIEMKLAYNKLRGYKHGGKKY